MRERGIALWSALLLLLAPAVGAGEGTTPVAFAERDLPEPADRAVRWVRVDAGALDIAGATVRFQDDGRSVVVWEGDRRAGTLRRLPGTVTLRRTHGRGRLDYRLLARRDPDGGLSVASLTGIPLGTEEGRSLVLDADLDGVFLEVGEDVLLLHDSELARPFPGEVWHRRRGVGVEEGRFVVLADDTTEVGRGLCLLNHCRLLAGLAPVREDPGSSAGSALHAKYVSLNWGQPFNHHTEDPANPHYTERGARAGSGSLFGYANARGPTVFTGAVVMNIDIVYHRRPLLDPRLRTVGMGAYPAPGERSQADAGPAVVAVLETKSGRINAPFDSPLTWPADGQHDVPTRFNGREAPMPLPAETDPGNRGYPVTLIFPSRARVEASTLTLYRIDRKGERHEIEGFSFGPDREIPSDGSTYDYAYRRNSGLCHFIARAPLPAETRFEAVGLWSGGGREHEIRWWFETGRRTDTPVE